MAVRVRTVQQQHLAVVFRTSVHQPAHGDVISIETQAHILDIDYQNVELTHGRIAGFLVLAIIERKNGHTGLGVYGAFHMFTGISIATESMFRRKDSHHIHLVLYQDIEQVFVTYHTCMIGENGNALAFQYREILGCLFGTHNHTIIICLTQQCKAQHDCK